MSFHNGDSRDLSDRSQAKITSETESDSSNKPNSSLGMDAGKFPEDRSDNEAANLAAVISKNDPAVRDLEAVNGESGQRSPYSIFTKRQKAVRSLHGCLGRFLLSALYQYLFPGLERTIRKLHRASSSILR